MASEASLQRRQRFEEVVRGLCLGILLVCGLWIWALLTAPQGLAQSRHGLVAAALQILLLGWAWLYRWGREGVRWQFGCGYVGFAVLAFNLYAHVFLGGGTWLLTMIGLAGVAYGLVPLARRPSDEAVARTPATATSPVAEPVVPMTARTPDVLEVGFQAQGLAFILMGGWVLLLLTRVEEWEGFLRLPAGKIAAAYLWMVIGGFWWLSMGRRGVTAKSLVASVGSAFMAANLYAEAFLSGGSWVVTLLAFLVNVAALMQWLPNRGMDALPRSPRLGDAPAVVAEPGGH